MRESGFGATAARGRFWRSKDLLTNAYDQSKSCRSHARFAETRKQSTQSASNAHGDARKLTVTRTSTRSSRLRFQEDQDMLAGQPFINSRQAKAFGLDLHLRF